MDFFERQLGRIYQRRFSDKCHESFFDGSGFCNFGYWTEGTTNGRQASNNLVDHLVGLLPDREGTILDVACGHGGTTQRLTSVYKPSHITAINLFPEQLAAAKLKAPGCTFRKMDATDLEFADNSFDAVICVEAAHHFRTREKFLQEAFRVLKPGRTLVLSDILLPRPPTETPQRGSPVGKPHRSVELPSTLCQCRVRDPDDQ